MKQLKILDGAMGTRLQTLLGPGANSNEAALNNRAALARVHKEYVDAGSDLVYSATFVANKYKAPESPVEDIIKGALEAAKESGAGEVALDVGPTGKLVGVYGDISFYEAVDAYKEVMAAGRSAGTAVIETMFDLSELRAAILAAKAEGIKNIMCTMSFTEASKTITGCTLSSFALTAQSLGASAIGLNCSVGPAHMANMVSELSKWSDLPLVCKPNAGMPDPITGEYDLAPAEFAKQCLEAAKYGAVMLGGCCGTAPEYIKALCDALPDAEIARPAVNDASRIICSRSELYDLTSDDAPAVLLENNAAFAAFKQGDFAALAEQALSLDARAITVDVDDFASGEKAAAALMEIAAICQSPLIIRGGSDAVKDALEVYTGRAGVIALSDSAKASAITYGAALA